MDKKDKIRYSEAFKLKVKVKSFLLDVKKRCADAGVTVIYLKSLPGMKRENGVAFWIDGNKRPMILLTLNGQRIDKILFSFYHEAYHILSDKKNLIYLGCGEKNDDEIKADEFAQETLLPGKANTSILGTHGNNAAINEIAKDFGICSALVWGRYSYLSKKFKLKYKTLTISWDKIGSWAFPSTTLHLSNRRLPRISSHPLRDAKKSSQ